MEQIRRAIKKNLLAFFVLLGFLIALLLVKFFSQKSSYQKREIFQREPGCEEEFDRTGNKQTELLKCGLLGEVGSYYQLLGRLKSIYVDEANLARMEIELFSPGNQLKNYQFVLGEQGRSYTWITIQKEKTLYHREGEYRIFEKKLDDDLLAKLDQFKNTFVLFTILKNGEEILGLDLTSADDKYKADIIFRQAYFRRCSPFLKKRLNLNEIESNCHFLYIHGLTFFKENLEL